MAKTKKADNVAKKPVGSTKKTPALRRKLLKWCDGFRLAALGIVLASKSLKFWLVFAVSFAIFGTLLSLLSGGMGAVNLFFATDFPGKLKILNGGFFALFGVGRSFPDWLLIFSISLLQALLIATIALVWQKKRKNSANAKNAKNIRNTKNVKNAESTKSSTPDRSLDVQSAGIVAGLAVLGSGCPTCGTALITPALGAIFSTGSYAIAGTVSGIITTLAIIIAILSLKKTGEQAYVIMVDEEWRKQHEK